MLADFPSMNKIIAGTSPILKIHTVSYLWLPFRLHIVDLFVLHLQTLRSCNRKDQTPSISVIHSDQGDLLQYLDGLQYDYKIQTKDTT